MSRQCDVCGKKPLAGKQIARRGIAKRSGGIGLKITGITIRRFLPNLQNVRAFINGGVKSLRVCVKCLKAGKVRKAPKRDYVKPAAA